MERGKRLPTVGIGAGYLYYNVTDKSVDDGMVFAQVSVPVSEWWGGAHALKKARIREQQAENDRLQAREMLAVEIERTWSEVQESYAQILLMRRSVESSAENLRQNRNFYKAGTAPLTDLLDAETLYTQSRNNLTSACASYRTALAKYMRVTGRYSAFRRPVSGIRDALVTGLCGLAPRDPFFMAYGVQSGCGKAATIGAGSFPAVAVP